jgi:hypothetical protein
MSVDDFDAWLEGAAKEAGASEVLESKAIAKLRARLHKAQRRIKAAETERDVSAERLDTVLSLGSSPVAAKIKRSRLKKSAPTEAVPVMTWSDWHVEEVVDPATVNGRNEYNPKISRERSQYLAEGCAWMIRQLENGWTMKNGVVWLGGDMITGYIHEELVEANAMSPTQAVLYCQTSIVQALLYIVENTKLKHITVVCSYGNHGRTTQKRRVQTGAANSYEWLMYNVLASRFEDDDRFSFVIADGTHTYTEILGVTVRWHHGDDVRYQGGVGGLSIPMRKAAMAWNTFKHADITVIGHWHQFKDFGDVVVNGSLIGYNAYALSIKARYEPPRQGFFLIDAEHGKRLVSPIHVEKKNR